LLLNRWLARPAAAAVAGLRACERAEVVRAVGEAGGRCARRDVRAGVEDRTWKSEKTSLLIILIVKKR